MFTLEKQRLLFLIRSCKEHLRAHPQLKLALLTFFIAGFQICLQGLFITEFSHALQTSASKIIFLESIALTCCLISNYFSAYFINRFSAFNVLKISILLFIFGDIIFYIILAHTKTPVNATWLSYTFSLVITGTGLGLLYPSINHMILGLRITSVKKASTLTWLNAFWNIGYCISSLIASTTAAAHKPNIPFLILSALFITLFMYLNKQTNINQQQTNQITLQSKRRNRINFNDIPQQLFFVGCICLVITFTQNTVEYWFPAYLKIEHQKGMSMTAFAMSFWPRTTTRPPVFWVLGHPQSQSNSLHHNNDHRAQLSDLFVPFYEANIYLFSSHFYYRNIQLVLTSNHDESRRKAYCL